ncbi:hypothetical protein RE474_10120 [Methanolobus sediminis]|uniref:DUF7507 domain-containing protein n=1 Tax=Methanolobus sediminis TaxID=3072978 RepID=A0AA51ULZ2_9EURY|nr:hypothetical protein [Methanolobus sediminis]WMW24440.1 hypothetical protein RE474_10120 [Methanolobus sediminis]
MIKTKNIWLLTSIFIIFTFAFSGITNANENNMTRILYVDQTIDVGTVNFSNDTEYLYVTYETTGDWTIQKLSLGISNSFNSTPINKGGNIVYGQFDYRDVIEETTIYTYEIPLEPYLPAENNTLYITASAMVNNGRNEVAWANGTIINERTSDATYFTYIISKTDEADEENPDDLKISINKTADFNDENDDGYAQEGENITYKFMVENTGNVTLTDVNVTDPMFTPSEIEAPNGFNGTLLQGENVTYIINYTLSQTDIEAEWVSNTATAAGISPRGTIVTDTDTVDFEIPVKEGGGITEENLDDLKISINKTADFNDENDDGYAQEGENITYKFMVENTGNVTLTDVNVTDPMFTPSEIEAPNGFNGTLLQGESVTYIINYTLSQTDIEAEWVNNTATAAGISPKSTIVTDTDTVDFEIPVKEEGGITEENPDDLKISINKTADFNDENDDGYAQEGENITYKFMVENTGNVTLTDVNVTDPMFTPSEIEAPNGFNGTLLQGESVTYIINYTLSQTDVEAEWMNNTATAAGISPSGTIVTDTDTVDFKIPVKEDDGSTDEEEKEDEGSGNSGGYGGSSGSVSYSREVTTTDDKNRFFSVSDIAEENETVMSIPDPIPEPSQQESSIPDLSVLKNLPWYIVWLLLSAICVMSGYGLTQP